MIAARLSNTLLLPDPLRSAGAPAPLSIFTARPAPSPIANPGPAAEPRRHSAEFLLQRGLTLAAMALEEAAIDTLREALALRPELAEAWSALARVLRVIGDRPGAAAAAAKAEALNSATPCGVPTPRGLPQGKRDQAERKLRETLTLAAPRPAEIVLNEHLLHKPDDVAALRILAQIKRQDRKVKVAENLLNRAIDLAPDYIGARCDLVDLLIDRMKAAPALKHIDFLLSQSPKDDVSLRLRASALAIIGEDQAAIEIYETMIKTRVIKDPNLWLNYALRLHYTGRQKDCVRAFRKCIELQPTRGEAYWGIANLKYETLTQDDVDTILHHLAHSPMTQTDHFHLHYTLGFAFEKAGDFERSFRHYSAGAAVRSAELAETGEPYNADDRTRRVENTKALMSAAFFTARLGAGHPSAAPIFVLGMPRSGSTLVEQILSSHSAIEGTQELPEIVHIALELGAGQADSPRFLQTISELSATELTELGQRYLENTAPYRKTDRPFFIDKMPFNWVNTGLIHLMFPNAKIIDTRREPMSCCFSVYKQMIARGAEFAYDLGDLGRFYNDYVDLMAHFDAVLPGRVHRVVYEQMVDDTENEIRRLLDYCGVPFEESCLRFWETKRSVATPSSQQVRKPIFRDALEQWRNYEPWLGPLKAALGVP